jgi:hypothetical protein
MNIGTLTIEMAANVARIRSDMDAAKSTVNGAMDSIKNAAGMAAKALGAIGVGLSVGAAVKGLYDLTIDAMKAQAALKGLSETTGATVEWLSSIRVVAKLAGTDMEAISGGLTKLAKNIETGSSEADKGLRAIGLSSKELQGLNTDQQFDKIAKALDGYADGAGKTAAAQLILGKSGAALLPFIKDYVEYGDLAVKTTAEQAKQADDLEKSIRGLTLAKEAWKKIVGTALVPVLGDVVKVLFKMQTETGGVNAEAKRLAGDGSIRKWAESAVIGVAYLVDILQGLWGLFKFVGAGIAGILASSMTIVSSLGEALVAIIKGNYSEIPGIVKGAVGAVQTIVLAAREDMKAGLFPDLMSDKFKKQFAESAAAVGEAAAAAKPKIKGLAEAAGGTTVAAVNALAKALDELLKKLNDADVDSEWLKQQELLNKALTVGAISVEAYWVAMAKAAAQSKTVVEMNKAIADSLAVNEKIINDNRQAIEDAARATRDSNTTIQQEIEQIGMTKVQRDLYNLALKKTIDLKRIEATSSGEEKAMRLDELEDLYAQAEQLIKNKDILEKQQDTWGELGKTVEGFFTDLFQNGRSAFSNLWSTIKSFFAQVAAKFATKFILDAVLNVSGGAGGIGGLLSSVLGGSGGAGGGLLSGLLGGGGVLGGLGSVSGLMGFGSGAGLLGALGGGANLMMTGLMGGGLSGMMGGISLAGSAGLMPLLGALGPIGAVIAGIAALVNIFAKDEKGIKFDNSLTSAGNPQNIQTSALGNFAPSGDVDAKMLAAFMPLFDKVKAFDDYIAKNLLSDETLATVQGQIQDLKNPRWWNLEDKDAIEKASKYFLQQRYSTAFDSINKSVADTIRTFSGTADELLTFIQDFIVMTETVKAAQAAAKEAAADTADTVAAIMEEQSNNVLYAYRAQMKASKDLLNIAPDGADALGAVVTGMQSLRSAAIQLAVQITQVKAAIDGMFSDSIRSISMSTMTKEEQYKFLQDESAQLYMKALTSTDPMEVQRLAEKINADVMAAWNLLTPEQQAAAKDEQIRRLKEVNAALDARVTTLGNKQQDDYIARMDQLSKKLDEVVVAQLDAAAKQNNAADKQLDAANTPKTVDVSLTINRTGDITNAEVGG